MTKQTIARFAGIAAGAGLALGVFAPVGAQTIAQLQAQIAALMAQLQALQGGTGVTNAISSDLTVGSSGQSVVVLQNALIAQGYLTMPAGVSTGYFGALTKAAVMKWQAANGLPATGFFGAMSRAKFGAGSTTGGTTTGGTTTGGTTGVISTPGAEGTLTVTTSPVSGSTLYEGDTDMAILAFKAKATGSDLALQRVKIDLGTDSDVYRDALEKISLVDDAGRVLASSDLSSSTVVKDGSIYYLTLSGFSSVVAKDASRIYTIKANVSDVIDAFASYTVRLAANGVRAIDGAGIDQYAPANATDVTRSITTAASLADSATLTLSTNGSTPITQEVIASTGASENEADKVVLLTFDLRAEKDSILVTDLVATLAATGGTGATASTSYLYAGNGTGGTLLGSAAVSVGTATFSDIDYTIPANTTKTFTLAVDVRSANATQTTLTATVAAGGITAEDSDGDSKTATGSATSNSILVRNVGPVFSLVGTPTITRTTASVSTNSTSTATATFNLKIKAVGSDVIFGTLASTTPMVSNGTNAPARSFVIYQNGSAFSTVVYASSTDYSRPSSGVVSGTESFTLQENNEITIPITFSFQGKLLSSGADVTAASYAVALERINWVSSNGLSNSTFMAGRTEWRTAAVTLP